jgi:hypothetical protein
VDPVKKTLPLVLAFLAGCFAIVEYFVPHPALDPVMSFLNEMAQVLASAAFLLGGINVLQVNVPIIRKRKADWPYKLVLVSSAALMALVGISWQELGGASSDPAPTRAQTGRTEIVVVSPIPDADVIFDGLPRVTEGGRLVLAVQPGAHEIAVRHHRPGYRQYAETLTVAAGETVTVTPGLALQWGTGGRVFTWFYDNVFDPCNSTMFALLAFFIASAAFRAFRARNLEAGLLLGAAILVMMGRIPIGRAISGVFPAIADWLVDYGNNAGRRAIMMGAALGAVATGLRVILGLERSHLGRD